MKIYMCYYLLCFGYVISLKLTVRQWGSIKPDRTAGFRHYSWAM